jgi:hypothetical protein
LPHQHDAKSWRKGFGDKELDRLPVMAEMPAVGNAGE